MISNEMHIGVHILTQRYKESYRYPYNQWYVEFENGYAASVLQSTFALGWEVAIVHTNNRLCYATPLTKDVIKCHDNLEQILDQIAQLPPNPECTHERN